MSGQRSSRQAPLPEVIAPYEIREDILTQGRKLCVRPFNYDGKGTLSMRPDSWSLLYNACCFGTDPLFDVADVKAGVGVAKDGTIIVAFVPVESRAMNRVLSLHLLDGLNIRYIKSNMATGATISGLITRQEGPWYTSKDEFNDLFEWLKTPC